jgi:hypothetical protein
MRFSRTVLGTLAIAMVATVSASFAQAPAANTPQLRFVIPQRPTVAAPVQPRGQAMAAAALGGGRWWIDPNISQALELTDEQHQTMDKAADVNIETQAEVQRKQMAAREEFEAALKARDWDRARKAAADWNRNLAESWGGQNTLKIEVLSKLTEAQQQKLWSQYPYLVQRPWGGSASMQHRHLESGPLTTPTPAPAPKK